MNIIEEKLQLLPEKPGVYLMKNSQGQIIYVGKAKILKNRVRSYFKQISGQTTKTQILVKQIVDFDYIVTGNELEALILECNLIKKYAPKYNILLKDDKSYPYIKLTVQEQFPRLYVTRKYERDGAKYFGPFADAQAVYATLALLRKTFKLRTCRTMSTGRACLRFYIKECWAPCQKLITVADYQNLVQQVELFLEGRSEILLQSLKKQIKQASATLDFEQAIVLKQQIQAVDKIRQEQKVISQSNADFDVLGLAQIHTQISVQVLLVRSGKLVGQHLFHLKQVLDSDLQENLLEFLKQYYLKATFIPSEIILPIKLEEEALWTEWFKVQAQQTVKLIRPQRGIKKDLLLMAQENAKIKLEEELAKRENKLIKQYQALEELAQALNLPNYLKRLECFDISHNQGQQTVASMVVFEDGLPAKKYYRRYKLKTVEGKPDDFLSMQEAISRRYRDCDNLPDLLVIDGGKGQLSSVCEILSGLGLHNLPVISLAKQFEHVFLPNTKYPIIMDKSSPALHILQNIRDEAHRFAITYHRKLRDKRNVTSILEHINGIGATRRKALMQYFKSIEQIKKASVEQLKQAPGINNSSAQLVYDFFHKRDL